MVEKIKVLIVDNDTQLSRRLSEHISKYGFESRYVSSIKEARKVLFEWHPKVILSNLVLTDGSGYEIFNFLKREEVFSHDFSIFMLMSAHNHKSNVQEALNMGVKDYIVKPFQLDEVLSRIVFQCRSLRVSPEAPENNPDSEATSLLHLSSLLLKQSLNTHSFEDTLFNMTKMLNLKLQGVRCNLVHCLSDNRGIIVTSNDDKNIAGLEINLNIYPEILHVRNTGRLIAVENLGEDENLRFIKKHMRNINFNSLIVCPIEHNGEFFGVLSLKLSPQKKAFSDNELRFVEISAQIMSLTLNSYYNHTSKAFWLKNLMNKKVA